jgi:hypothetical protein
VKSGLFKRELKKIEYLSLGGNKIKTIEPEAFQYLINLKWVNLGSNIIQSLPYQLFKNSPDLIYISFRYNKIASIHPSFFDGLQNLKLVDFTGNRCIQTQIGCETCSINQSSLRGKLQGCFKNCSKGTTCHTSYLSYEASQTTEIPQITTVKPIESDITKNRWITETKNTMDLEQVSRDNKLAIEEVEARLLNVTNDLKTAVENMPKVIEETIETNNNLTQKALQKLQESIAEIKSCCTQNQVEPRNGPNDQSAQLFEAQLENTKLRLELLELKCAKKEEAWKQENKALREEIQKLKREG